METTTEMTWRPPIAIFRPSQTRLDQLGAWFDSEYPGLLRFAYFVCGNRSHAEDLVQDAFVRLYKAGARVEGPSIGAYARRTIVNMSRSAFRRTGREASALRRLGPPAATTDGPDPAIRDEMWRAIQGLSSRQRAVVALKFYEDMSERDIAATLGMSAGSVKKHADRALTHLRAALGDGRQR